MKVKYFAWVRERIGKAEETIEPPAEVRTVGDLIGWLGRRGETYAYAFETPRGARAAPLDRRRHHPDPASRFRRRARDRGVDARPHGYRRGRKLFRDLPR